MTDETSPSDTPRKISIYRASTDPGVFVATVRENTDGLPPCPNYGTWEPYTDTALDGSNAAQYREDDAERDIEQKGYHMFRVVIRPDEVS